MIGEEKFIELINDYRTYDIILNNADGIFPGIFESKLVHFTWKWYEELLHSYFDKDGWDWITWYLYEDGTNWTDENGVKHTIETVDDLWELVKNHRI